MRQILHWDQFKSTGRCPVPTRVSYPGGRFCTDGSNQKLKLRAFCAVLLLRSQLLLFLASHVPRVHVLPIQRSWLLLNEQPLHAAVWSFQLDAPQLRVRVFLTLPSRVSPPLFAFRTPLLQVFPPLHVRYGGVPVVLPLLFVAFRVPPAQLST